MCFHVWKSSHMLGPFLNPWLWVQQVFRFTPLYELYRGKALSLAFRITDEIETTLAPRTACPDTAVFETVQHELQTCAGRTVLTLRSGAISD